MADSVNGNDPDSGGSASEQDHGALAPRPHPDVAARRRRGREARRAVPRRSLGYYDPGPDRPDPVDLLRSQEHDRISGLLPIRYGRMLTSPFAFYRGGALIMASDLSTGPRSGLDAQLCGDAHLANFGAYGSPERRLVFDVNDFDETHPGPFEWDVKRLVASVELAGQHNGFSAAHRRALVVATSQAYRAAMTEMAGLANLDAWNAHIDVQDLAHVIQAQGGKKVARRLETAVTRAQSRNSVQAFDKLTAVVDGQRRIVSQPPLIVPLGELVGDEDPKAIAHAIHQGFRKYRASLPNDRRHLVEQFQLVDIAHKVVGVGSVGTRCWIMLLSGRDGSDPLFLQIKQAGPSVLEQYTHANRGGSPSERVVHGQRLMQSASDIFLGWTRVELGDQHDYYYVRQLRDWKLSADLASLKPKAMRQYVSSCAIALAHAHARSADRIAIAAYVGSRSTKKGPNSFDRAMAAFARSYARQNNRDYAALKRAVADGRVRAASG